VKQVLSGNKGFEFVGDTETRIRQDIRVGDIVVLHEAYTAKQRHYRFIERIMYFHLDHSTNVKWNNTFVGLHLKYGQLTCTTGRFLIFSFDVCLCFIIFFNVFFCFVGFFSDVLR